MDTSSNHLLFDVKIDFNRKAIKVKNGHRNSEPETSSYVGVVSRDSTHIALTIADLQGVYILEAAIRNTYL